MRATTRLAVLATSVALVATAAGATTAQAEDGSSGDIKIDKIVVNGGKPVVVGTTNVVSAKVSVTASDDSGIAETTYISAFGPNPNYAQIWADDGDITCVKVSATTSTRRPRRASSTTPRRPPGTSARSSPPTTWTTSTGTRPPRSRCSATRSSRSTPRRSR
jgi:hypothetical protein